MGIISNALNSFRAVAKSNNEQRATQAQPPQAQYEEVKNEPEAPAACRPSPISAEAASAHLDKWEFTPYAKTLLDRAVTNVQANDGSRFTVDQGRDRFRSNAMLLSAAGGRLDVAMIALYESGAQWSTISSLLYSIMKSALFLGNIDYRRALDPASDDDLQHMSDLREQHRDAPPGLQPDPKETDGAAEPLNGTNNRAHTAAALRVPDYGVIENAIEEINIFLDLLAKSSGAPLDGCMPYTNVQAANGVDYDPVYSVSHALDIAEVTRQKSRAKREEARAKDVDAATRRVKDVLLRMAQTK